MFTSFFDTLVKYGERITNNTQYPPLRNTVCWSQAFFWFTLGTCGFWGGWEEGRQAQSH